MIEFGQITGNTDNNTIEVKMRTGESLYAPLVVIGTGVSIPSEEWIKTNKGNFLALVSYEGSSYDSPMIIGFYPVKGADSSAYNVSERLLKVATELIDQLLKAKVNTMLGPQPFMPDSIQVFTNLQKELDEISKMILPLKL